MRPSLSISARDETDPADDHVFSESLRQKINVAHCR